MVVRIAEFLVVRHFGVGSHLWVGRGSGAGLFAQDALKTFSREN